MRFSLVKQESIWEATTLDKLFELNGERSSKSKTEYKECMFSRFKSGDDELVKIEDNLIPPCDRFRYLEPIMVQMEDWVGYSQ